MTEVERIDYLITVYEIEREKEFVKIKEEEFEEISKEKVKALTKGIDDLNQERDRVLSKLLSILKDNKVNELKVIIDLRDEEIRRQNAIINSLKND